MRLWDTRDRQERELLLLLLLLLNIFSFSLARLDRMGRCFLWSPQSSRTLWFSSVDEDYSRGRNAPKNPLDSFLFCLFFFSAKNLKYKKRKKHPKRIHLRKHTHTHNSIHLPPVRLQFSPRNRVCNKIFFRCVSRAWEHREADRRERQQQEKKRKERKERKKKKKLLFWRWMSRVSRRRWRRRQSV